MTLADALRLWGLKEYIQGTLRREKQNIHKVEKFRLWGLKMLISQVSLYAVCRTGLKKLKN